MLIDLPEMPDDLPTHLKTVVYPQLPACIQAAFLNAVDDCVKRNRWQSMPNQSLAVERPNLPVGTLHVGDSFNMRHPLTGGGMTVGLTDVELLLRLMGQTTDWHDHARVHATVHRFYDERIGKSAVINILADALYQVFLTSNPDLQEGCFEYLRYPLLYRGPVDLLSG
jgi:squalene monooxygenase